MATHLFFLATTVLKDKFAYKIKCFWFYFKIFVIYYHQPTYVSTPLLQTRYYMRFSVFTPNVSKCRFTYVHLVIRPFYI